MSLESEVKKLTEAVLGLTAVISASQAQPPSAPPTSAPASVASPAAAATATVAPTASQPSPAPTVASPSVGAAAGNGAQTPAAQAKGPTLDEVKAITTKLAAFGHPDSSVGRDAAIELLKSYGGASKASQVPAEKYGEFVERAKARLAQLELAK